MKWLKDNAGIIFNTLIVVFVTCSTAARGSQLGWLYTLNIVLMGTWLWLSSVEVDAVKKERDEEEIHNIQTRRILLMKINILEEKLKLQNGGRRSADS